jgi:phospholipid-translocating ATPase
MYNILFTSLPIMWYALFDFEHTKNVFMSKPLLYKLGMDNKCFTKYVFWSWIGYAFWQGLLVISFAFLFNQTTLTSISSDGKTFNFWSGGMTVYGTSVLIVNAVLLKMATSYTGY